MITLPEPRPLPSNIRTCTVSIDGDTFTDVACVELSGEFFPALHRADPRANELRAALGAGRNAEVTMEGADGVRRTYTMHLSPLRTTDPE